MGEETRRRIRKESIMASHNDRTSVVDSDAHFIIDLITRKVISNTDKSDLVQFDHNSERITFECPRYIEGHDMLNCNKVIINYLDDTLPGVYEVDDLKMKDSDTTMFSWLISSNATQKVGKIFFAITFMCVQTNGDVTYRWNTAINEGLKVIEGMNQNSTIVYDNVDILEQWKQQLFGTSDGEISKIQEATNKMLESIPSDYSDLDAQVKTNTTNIGQIKEDLKNVAVTDGSITTSKIADKAVTGDKIDFIDKKEFHFYTPTGDANAENESAIRRNYMIPFEVGTPYIYMIMQTRLQGRQFGSVNAPYKSAINNWSSYGYNVSQAIGTVKDKTVQLWSYPEKPNSSNYPWTECRKFDCTELNQYFEKSQLSGTQTIYCEVGKENCGWFGVDNDTWTNKEKLSILWLKEEPTLNDWLNGFETVETLNKNVEANFLKMRDALGMYHNILDYGITTDADDNSLKLQQMIDELSENGGGTIYVPIGTYKFNTSNGQYIEGTGGCKCCVKAKSNVSIVGESLTDSVFKMTGHSSQGVCMFGYNSATNKTPIEGCTYRNFTVNGEECTIDTYSSDGKAFFYQYVKNCVWRDLRLIGTPATSLGIDFLDNVVIDSIYCYESGRIHADNSPGGAGVGIGTGAWENENFIVRNCICDNCGHFGIFLEDQHIFGDAAHRTPTYPKGAIIANNICRNGRNYGFGVRGGQHVIFDGNEAYENANGGFFSDYQNKSIVIQNNLIRDNTGNGICLGNEKPGILETSFENVTIKDNVVIGNKTGINISQKTTNLNLIDNIVRDNTVKDITVSATQTSCYISGNLVLTADVSNYLNKVENSEL